MRTIKTWLTTMAVLLCSISASAYDFVIDGICYNILSAADRTVEMTGHSIYGDIIIPSTVRFNNIDFTVTRIGDRAFHDGAYIDEEHVASVILPNTIVSIGSYAFQYCHRLKEISIPEGVTTIETGTFMGCESLERIKLSTKTEHIGEAAFKDCASLKPFDFLEMLSCIDSEAFENCVSLTYFKVSSGLTIGYNAFRNSAKIILLQPWGMFNNSDAGSSSFDDNTLFILRYETSTVDFDGDGIEDILCSDYNYLISGFNTSKILFYDSSLTDAEIDYILETGGMVILNGVKYRITSLLNAYTMEVFGCNNGITTADIVSKINYLNREFTVTKIKESAFANNTTLTTVKIPNSIKSIGNNAFAGCTALSKVTTESATPLSINDGCFDVMAQLFATLYVPVGAVETYKSAAVWKGFGNITEAGVSYSTLTLKANAGGTITCEGTSVSNGTEYINTTNSSVVITFTPNNYYTLAKVVVDGADVTSDVSNGVLSINVSADTEIEAIFDTQDEIQLQDKQTSFELVSNISCDKITYTRNFTNTAWQSLYVPFEIPVTEALLEDFEIADLNDVRQYDRDDDGVKDETVIEAFKVKSGVLEANYPYLIRAREAGEKTITVTDATLFAAEENSIDCSSVREKFTFTGTYSQLSSEELPQGEGYYALSGGVWQPVAEGASLGAFRFYLKVDSRNSLNATQGNAIRMRIIGEDGEEDDATGIDTSDFKNQKSELIFDLQGRRVENPTKGVYIVNGVKRVF